MTTLNGRTALIFGAGSAATGASNGMAASLTYARAGANIVAVDVDSGALEVTVAAITAEGYTCMGVVGDVRSEGDIANAVSEAVKSTSRIDILHNNVGLLRLGGPEDLDTADWDVSMEANVRGVFLACKYTLPIMKGQGRGVITNISSIAGIRWCGRPMVAYSASKAAINQLSQSVAVEHARYGIRCNAIIPGLMNTPMVVEPYAHIYGDVDMMIAERHALCPSGRMGTAWDIAEAALFLASDAAGYINGALLPVDGGLSCKSF